MKIDLNKIRTGAEVIGIAICAVLLWLVMQKPTPGPVGKPMVATDAPEVAGKPKVPVTPAKVMAYPESAKADVILPPDVSADPAIAVLESSKVAASERPQTVTTTLNKITGATESYVTANPYPWLATENRMEVAIAYGIKNGGVRVGRLSFSDDLLQVKAWHGGVVASLDSDGLLFAGVRLACRF